MIHNSIASGLADPSERKRGEDKFRIEELGSENQRRVQVSVRDTGSGVPPEFVEQIFVPFSRAEKHVRSAIPGVGLGLSLSHKLASAAVDTRPLDSQRLLSCSRGPHHRVLGPQRSRPPPRLQSRPRGPESGNAHRSVHPGNPRRSGPGIAADRHRLGPGLDPPTGAGRGRPVLPALALRPGDPRRHREKRRRELTGGEIPFKSLAEHFS